MFLSKASVFLYILFPLLFLYSLLIHHSNVNEKETTIPQQVSLESNAPVVLKVLDDVSEGDVISGEFVLRYRLDFLGIQESHIGEETSFLLAGSSEFTSIIEYSSAEGGTPAKTDISLIKQAFRINEDNSDSVKNDFHLNEKVFFGGHGEIWLAHRIINGEVDLNDTFVLKRMNLVNRPDILRCALREIYFGELLQYDPRSTHLVAHFLHKGDYWLAFEDDGVSLQQLLYAVSFTPSSTILEPSAIWRTMRSSKEGDESLKSILYQIIKGVENLHSKGILHRDIKPSNLLINAKNKSGESGEIRLIVSDYSSAVSEMAFRSGLYGALDEKNLDNQHPPSVAEESPQYSPPEVTFSCYDFDIDDDVANKRRQRLQGSGVPSANQGMAHESRSTPDGKPPCEKIAYDPYRPESYDIWSIGNITAIYMNHDAYHLTNLYC